VASGSLTHNLYEFRGATPHGAQYVKDFAAWTAKTLASGDLDQLLDYKRYAPSAERAHPTDEHYLPLFIALGAAGETYETRVLEGGVTYGVLAMDSYLFSSAHSDRLESADTAQGAD
jgi:4,5-DOPA dioxygenase extradiol